MSFVRSFIRPGSSPTRRIAYLIQLANFQDFPESAFFIVSAEDDVLFHGCRVYPRLLGCIENRPVHIDIAFDVRKLINQGEEQSALARSNWPDNANQLIRFCTERDILQKVIGRVLWIEILFKLMF
jgi:hypothetical protein